MNKFEWFRPNNFYNLMAKKHIDRAALIATIRDLKELSNEQKSDILQLISGQKKYGLVWEDSPEEVEENLRNNVPVLVEDKDKAIVSNIDDAPNHILIEGDNLEALTALSYTHEGKIDVIYIDPPYNTGNKDFVYNDSFVDTEDGYRHSKWLSFMEKRLKIAKKLLSDKGVIFISIDDNEQANLKLLCDEVFGSKNFVANVCQKSRDSISGDSLFSKNHNYLLVYTKSFEKLFARRNEFRIPTIVDESKFKNPDNDPRGPWKLSPVDGPGGARKGNPYYEFLGVEMFFRYSKEQMQKYYDDGLIVKRKTSLGKKYFLSQAKSKNGEPPTTWWDDAGTTTAGTKMVKEILPEKEFTNPKPVSLILRCLQLASFKDSIIFDFFAGSGTTLHATMQLNAEDGGHRQCILCTNNENNICEEVTYERNKRVINGYTTPKGVEVEGLHDNSLRYYKIEDVPRDSSTTGLKKLMLASTDLLCIKNDLYEEQSVFGNIKLRKNIARYFDDGKQKMLIIYKVDAIESIVEEIKKMPADTFIKVYVFSTNNYAMDADFEEVSDKVFLCALPAAIYNAYKKVLPRKNNVITEEEEE
jgi:adenine-specific DNA-methyltransferase